MITNEQINDIIIILEPEILAISNRFAIKFRDDIQQETRLKIWKYLVDTYKEEPIVIKDAVQYARDNLYFLGLMSSKMVIRQYTKNDKRYTDITNMDFPMVDNQEMVDFAIDCKKYSKILSKKEMLIVEYLFSANEQFTNFDNISRQLGLTGKGASRYTLNVIAKKILNYRSKMI